MFPQTVSLKKINENKATESKANTRCTPDRTGLHSLYKKEAIKIENKITWLLPWGLPQAMKKHFISNPNFFHSLR